MARHELTDTQWDRLAPLLPPQKPHTGRPNKDHRTIINALLWLLRTGAPWRGFPERYGSWKTVASRFYRWQRAEVWQHILQCLQREAEAEGQLDFRRIANRYQKRAAHYLGMLTIAALVLWI